MKKSTVCQSLLFRNTQMHNHSGRRLTRKSSSKLKSSPLSNMEVTGRRGRGLLIIPEQEGAATPLKDWLHSPTAGFSPSCTFESGLRKLAHLVVKRVGLQVFMIEGVWSFIQFSCREEQRLKVKYMRRHSALLTVWRSWVWALKVSSSVYLFRCMDILWSCFLGSLPLPVTGQSDDFSVISDAEL